MSFALPARHVQTSFAWIARHKRHVQRIVVIMGAVLLTAVATSRISVSVVAVTLALPVGITAVLVLLQKPFLGPLALIVTGLVGNLGTSDNFNATVLLLVFLTALWFFAMVVRKQLLADSHSPALRPLLALAGAAILAFVMGQLPWFPVPPAPLEAQIAGIAVYLLSACAFLMVGAHIGEVRWLQWMVWLFLIVGSLYVFGRVLPRPVRYLVTFFPWGSTSCLFWLWLAAHTFSQLLLNRRLGFLARAGLALLLIATLYAVLVQTYDWKSGWIPVVSALGAIIGLRWPRLLVVMGIGALFAMPVVLSQLISGDAYSYSTRLDAWRIMLQIIQVSPIFGLGPSNYYGYSALYDIRGYSVSFNSHNQYIDLVAQTGIIGLFCYLWFFVAVARMGWRLRHLVPSGFAHAYLYGSLGGLCSMLVAGVLGDWILPFVYNVGLVGIRSSLLGWLFLGGLLTLDRLYGQPDHGELKHVPPPQPRPVIYVPKF